MSKEIHITFKDHNCRKVDTAKFTLNDAEKVLAFHKSFPEYTPTPLVALNSLAEALGVSGIFVKDESKRFGLNAFKALGGSYAIGKCVAEKLGMNERMPDYAEMTSDETRAKLGDVTFVTATDGNHGRGVAWTANRLKQKSVVYMPKGTAAERLENIRNLGSDASITPYTYDKAVELAAENAQNYGWLVIQDTAWEGYERVPEWIMQGYTTMALEALRQLGERKITHLFLQAGVGSMAAAVAAFFANAYGEDRPVITIVEPTKAGCIYETALADDGQLHEITDGMDTIMAGLACGRPCPPAWNILKRTADAFVMISDDIAANGMRVLGNPLKGDERVISGESGASTMGFVTELLRNKKYAAIKEKLGLDENSTVLCFSTEGDTDRENYRRVVWDGLYASSDDQ